MKDMSPLTPLGYLLLVLEHRAPASVAVSRAVGTGAPARRDERGASAVEWIIIAAIVVGVCGLIAAILVPALTGEANEISDEIRRQ